MIYLHENKRIDPGFIKRKFTAQYCQEFFDIVGPSLSWSAEIIRVYGQTHLFQKL
jgi:hypothetical protein